MPTKNKNHKPDYNKYLEEWSHWLEPYGSGRTVLHAAISLTLIRNGHLLVILKRMHISAWEDAEFLPD